MTAVVVPFPLVRRRSFIERQARYAAELTPGAADKHIQQQLKIQADAMIRRGIDLHRIEPELESMATAIRSALCRVSLGSGGRS